MVKLLHLMDKALYNLPLIHSLNHSFMHTHTETGSASCFRPPEHTGSILHTNSLNKQ